MIPITEPPVVDQAIRRVVQRGKLSKQAAVRKSKIVGAILLVLGIGIGLYFQMK